MLMVDVIEFLLIAYGNVLASDRVTVGGLADVRQFGIKTAFMQIFTTVFLAIFVLMLIRSMAQNFRVEGSSMEPTISSGQRVIISKASYWRFDLASFLNPVEQPVSKRDSNPIYPFGAPSRGDVVVFRYPLDLDRAFVKRVIGIPGDVVEIKKGTVYVNGGALNEPYVKAPPSYEMAARMIPADNLFVLGDNRDHSSDSHIWGLVPTSDLIDKAVMVYWPLDHLGMISSPNLPAQADRWLEKPPGN
jgi:signal peptidase I